VLLLPPGGRVAIGSSGLRPSGGAIVATKCGVVRRTRGGQLWIEGRQKRWASPLRAGFRGEAGEAAAAGRSSL
jgi:hypothetical protein